MSWIGVGAYSKAQNQYEKARPKESGLERPMVRSAFYQFAIVKLLTDEQADIVAFACNRGASLAQLGSRKRGGRSDRFGAQEGRRHGLQSKFVSGEPRYRSGRGDPGRETGQTG